MNDSTNSSLMQLADPVLTANIYCEGRLDQVIHGALIPFRRALAERNPGGLWRLWFVRYPRRGEHLKVRLHGPEGTASEVRALLSDAVEACFATLPPPVESEPRLDGRGALPIDLEDEHDGFEADRCLLWTHYRRHHVSLGGPPLLDNDLYAELMTTCLAQACELVLESLRPDGEGLIPHGQRQSGLLRLVTGGLGALGFGNEKSAAYLAYHRDWLLRFIAVRSRKGTDEIGQILAQFDQRVQGMDQILDAWRVMVIDAWSGSPCDHLEGSDANWWSSLRNLQAYLDRFRGQPDYQLDPFATDVVFSPVFKVLHGGANQIGLNMLNEAFTHHLLWRAVTA